MLPSRVAIPAPPKPEVEDIFSSSLSVLFTDDTQNSHGIPGQSVTYTSPRYGDIKLGIPRHPDVEEGRKLFAHYLWNAGVLAADAIETASHDTEAHIVEEGKVRWNQLYWDVRNTNVLELGSGTALPSLICALSSAHSVTITDHPSSPALITDTIAQNVLSNLNINLLPTSSGPNPGINPPRTFTHVQIHGLTWGDELFTSPTTYGRPSHPQPAAHSFDKIIIADCLWMPSQHGNIVKTINSYLRQASDEHTTPAAPTKAKEQNQTQHELSTQKPCALIVAGFHTGRSTVARFFEIATGSRTGTVSDKQDRDQILQEGGKNEDENEDETVRSVKGALTAAEIFEVDVDCNVRPWLAERPGEDRDQAKRWCVCAALVRR